MRTVFAFSAIALAAALAGAPTQSHAQAPLAWPYSEFAKSESSNKSGTRAKRERSRSETSDTTTSRRKRASEDRYASSDEDRPQRRGRTARSSGGGGGSSDGLASYYWQPQRVASGGWFNPDALTAAHKTLPFGTKVRVTNSGNGKSVVVTINDRGPYVGGRVIDLSRAAAGAISMQSQGVAPVRLEVLGR